MTNALTYSAAVLDTYLNVAPFYMYICSILALPTNIRLRRKWLAVTNALTYSAAVSDTYLNVAPFYV